MIVNIKYSGIWRKWFAWKPVVVDYTYTGTSITKKTWAWLCWIERRRVRPAAASPSTEYRLIPTVS